MRRVIQEDRIGCGIACVAMLACVTYAEARQVMFDQAPVRRTYTVDLKKALIVFGKRPAYRTVRLNSRALTTIVPGAIIKTNVRKHGSPEEEWHWIVWDGERILDPKEPPYRRYRHDAYLTVE